MAVAERGTMYDPSSVFYMEKLVTGPRPPTSSTSPRRSSTTCRPSPRPRAAREDVTVCILDRPRHEDLVREVREAGARIKFITDGDVAGAVMAASEGTGVDLLLGIGGTPEGIITAAR